MAKSWLSDATMATGEDGPILMIGTRFKADYIRQTFGIELERTASACGLDHVPAVGTRPPVAR